MEYLDGAPLTSFSGKPWTETLPLLVQAAHGMEYLASRGIVHRDLSPDNILVIERGGDLIVKLLDFGIAKLFEHATGLESLTATGFFLGKVAYGSPEQLGSLGHGATLDWRSDVYSLGVIFYQVLAGQRPFDGKAPVEYIAAHLNATAPPVAAPPDAPPLPVPLVRLIGQMLEKRREDRPGELARDRGPARGRPARDRQHGAPPGVHRPPAPARADGAHRDARRSSRRRRRRSPELRTARDRDPAPRERHGRSARPRPRGRVVFAPHARDLGPDARADADHRLRPTRRSSRPARRAPAPMQPAGSGSSRCRTRASCPSSTGRGGPSRCRRTRRRPSSCATFRPGRTASFSRSPTARTGSSGAWRSRPGRRSSCPSLSRRRPPSPSCSEPEVRDHDAASPPRGRGPRRRPRRMGSDRGRAARLGPPVEAALQPHESGRQVARHGRRLLGDRRRRDGGARESRGAGPHLVHRDRGLRQARGRDARPRDGALGRDGHPR